MSNQARNLAKISIMRVVQFFVCSSVSFLTMPFIIRALGDNRYGMWVLAGSFLGYYGLMDFGLTHAVQRFVSQSGGMRDESGASAIASTAFFIYACIGGACLAVSLVTAFAVPRFVPSITEKHLFQTLMIILGVNFSVGMPLRVFTGILSANLRYDYISAVSLGSLVLRTACIIVFLVKGGGIIALALITLISDIGIHLTHMRIVARLFPRVIISARLFRRDYVKKLFGYSVFSFISNIADQLRFNIDNLVITLFLGLPMVTLYSIGSRVAVYFITFINSAIGMTMPVFSRYEGIGDMAAVRESFLFLAKISALLSALTGGLLVMFGRPLIERWVGASYGQAYTIMLIIVIPLTLEMAMAPGWGVLFGLSKHRYFAFTNIAEGVANLVLSIILVSRLGILGVALGTAIPMVLVKGIIQPIYTCRIIGINPLGFYAKVIVPVFGLSVAVISTVWFLFRSAHTFNIMTAVSQALAAVCLFAFAAYMLGFRDKEKEYFRKAFERKARPV